MVDTIHAAGQHGFKILHGQRPGEGFFIEELVEGLGLEQHLVVGRRSHHILVSLPLLGDAGDLAVERMVAGAGCFGFAVQKVQSQPEEDSEEGEYAHADAQTLVGRSQVSEGAGGEIESDAHCLTHPR